MRQVADAAVRNAGPILEVLARVLPPSGRVLELGSGTGQHAVTFAAALPGLSWQPSDPSESARASIAAWIEHAGVTNVLPPIDLDARMRPWRVPDLAAVVCINVVHISPWDVTRAILAGASEALPVDAPLVLYGPYFVNGWATESNVAFDASLRARDPAWGVRELREVEAEASTHGLRPEPAIAMPANNLVVVFRKT